MVRVFTGYERPGVPFDKQYALVVEGLKLAGQKAAEHGVTLAVQNHHDIAAHHEMMYWLLKEVNLPNVKAAFDAWTPTLEGLSPEEIKAAVLKMKPFIRAGNIGDLVRGAIRTAGFRWRPYVLRSYFDTQLMLAESKGLVLRDYRQFWMGHKGDIENRYTTNKSRLPDSVINDMRQAYGRSQEYLQTAKTAETSEEKLAQAFRKQLLLVAGFKQDEVDKMDLSAINDEQLQDIVRKRLLGISTDDCPKQKVVNIGEVENYLSQGWEYVANLPNKRVVIKLNG